MCAGAIREASSDSDEDLLFSLEEIATLSSDPPKPEENAKPPLSSLPPSSSSGESTPAPESEKNKVDGMTLRSVNRTVNLHHKGRGQHSVIPPRKKSKAQKNDDKST